MNSIDNFQENKLHSRRNENGFTLLELLISMTLFLIVTGAVFGVLHVARNSRLTANNQVVLTKNVRVALNLISRDTYNAGFGYPVVSTVVLPDSRISTLLGIPNDFDTSRDTIPPILAANALTLNTLNTAGNVRTDQVTFLFKDSTFNLVSTVSQPLNINAPTTVNGIDQIIPISGSNSACRVNDIFLISGNTGSALGVVTGLVGSNTVQFNNGDSLGFNQVGSALVGITTPASMQRVNMVSYFVTANGVLTRREFANVVPTNGNPPAAFNDFPLVYGVDDFQIRYILDDGSITDDPSAGPDNIPGTADDVITNLAKVRQIRYTISVTSTETNQKGEPFHVNMTTTVSTRNLGYDAS